MENNKNVHIALVINKTENTICIQVITYAINELFVPIIATVCVDCMKMILECFRTKIL